MVSIKVQAEIANELNTGVDAPLREAVIRITVLRNIYSIDTPDFHVSIAWLALRLKNLRSDDLTDALHLLPTPFARCVQVVLLI